MPHAEVRHPSLQQSYQERASLPHTSPLASYFLRLIAAKRSNLCVSADVTSTRELLQLAEEVGDHICLLKTHADIINDFGTKTRQDLQVIARRKGFLIFEDRKFGDIGNTVQLQYTAGPLQIVRWANIVNAHIFPGPAIVKALAQAANDAVAAYNTSVETEISGPPTIETDQEHEDEDVPEASFGTGTDGVQEEEQDGDRLSSDEDEDDGDPGEPVIYSDEEDQLGDLGRTSSHRKSTNDDPERKYSVVSISTTISTKTEQISPAPTPLHTRTMSHDLPSGAIDPSPTTPTAASSQKAVRALGDPPMVRGMLLLAQMSSAGNLMDADYTQKCLDAARESPDFVLGFIAQRCMNEAPTDNFISMAPGVQIGSKGDSMGQQYNTPEAMIGEAGVDVVIVGRGVYGAVDRRKAAEEYRERAWDAYEARIGSRKKSA